MFQIEAELQKKWVLLVSSEMKSKYKMKTNFMSFNRFNIFIIINYIYSPSYSRFNHSII